jgi:hypothetical protein
LTLPIVINNFIYLKLSGAITMDETQNYAQETVEGNELSHSDKAVGIFTEPSNTFEQTAKFPPRTIDWLLPFAILLLIVAVSNILMMSNKDISYEIRQKQVKAIEEMAERGTITQEQAESQIEATEQMMNSPIAKIISVISIFIVGFIFFFIITGIYYLFVKLLFKGNGSFSSALVANGLTSYIGIIQVLSATILAFLFGRLMKDASVASLFNIDSTTFSGFLLGKLDIISIWAYIVLGIGLAKMFKSQSTGKYIFLSLALWILGGLLMFFLIKAVPFLSFMGG